MVEMRVMGLTIDPQSKNPMVILREVNGDTLLPIWLGAMEAMAVSLVLNKEELPRPLTHDLMLMNLQALKTKLSRVEITDLKEGVYYALLILRGVSGMAKVDCRPSDGIALALRAHAPIYVDDAVLRRSAEAQTKAEARLRAEMPPDHPADAATDMLRTAGAQKQADIINGFLSRHGSLPAENSADDDKELRELLRSLEPVTRHKM